MLTLLVALLAVLLCASIAYGLLKAAGLSQEAASTISAGLVTLVPFLHQLLRDKELRYDLQLRPLRIIPRLRFDLRWQLVLAYASVLFFGLSSLISTVGAFALYAMEVPLDGKAWGRSNAVVSSTLNFAIAYFIGRWIGIRCASNGLITIALTALITRIMFTTFEFYLVPTSEWHNYYIENKSWGFAFQQVILGTLLFSAFMTLGHWRGRHLKLGRYMQFLLDRSSDKSRDAIVDLAYQEATASVQTAGDCK